MRESPIFVQAYDLLAWLLPATQKFPKAHRFVLAARIESSAFDLYEHLLRAVRRPAGAREALSEADIALDRLRAYLRLAKDLKLLSLDGYEHAAKRVAEIGRLLGGWQARVKAAARGRQEAQTTMVDEKELGNEG